MLRRNWLFLLVLTFSVPAHCGAAGRDGSARIAALKRYRLRSLSRTALGSCGKMSLSTSTGGWIVRARRLPFKSSRLLPGALTCDGYQLTFSPADAYVP